MTFDALIIGGGHNGLVAAATLAQAGKSVLVVEQRPTLGGAAATEEVFPGFKINTGAHDAGLFLTSLLGKFELQKHGLAFIESPVAVWAPQADGTALTLWRDPKRNREEIRRFSTSDADKWPDFLRTLQCVTRVLRTLRTLTPPDLADKSFSEVLPWLKVALRLKRMGKHDMMEFFRILPMTTKEFLDEWFESETLKGVLGAAGVTGSMQGPQASGTAFMMLYQYLGAGNGGFRASRFVRGGMGNLSKALAEFARQHGAEIRTGVAVSQIVVNGGKAAGVVLANGEEIAAHTVLSNADPARTFFKLVGAPGLGPQFVRKVRNIRYRGSTAKVNLALNGLPHFAGTANSEAQLSGHILICPDLEYLERAYDDAKYGQFSKQPYLDIVLPTLLDASLAPAGKHIMSISMQYAPYHLKDGTWDEAREKLGDCVVNTLSQFAPNLPDLILHRQVLTPLDWEREYGLTEGSIFHGQMGLDQLLFMRPVAGFGQYRTPIENLYLCGAGTHPGGGVTGAPGFNAAREVLKDWKRGQSSS
ncbi:MAG: phytoene desaturase family protein [bacterium]